MRSMFFLGILSPAFVTSCCCGSREGDIGPVSDSYCTSAEGTYCGSCHPPCEAACNGRRLQLEDKPRTHHSAHSCEQLGWPLGEESEICSAAWCNAEFKHDNNSVVHAIPSDMQTWLSAHQLCLAAGARLCTLRELEERVHSETGCEFGTNNRVWSGDRCTGGQELAWATSATEPTSFRHECAFKYKTESFAICCADRLDSGVIPEAIHHGTLLQQASATSHTARSEQEMLDEAKERFVAGNFSMYQGAAQNYAQLLGMPLYGTDSPTASPTTFPTMGSDVNSCELPGAPPGNSVPDGYKGPGYGSRYCDLCYCHSGSIKCKPTQLVCGVPNVGKECSHVQCSTAEHMQIPQGTTHHALRVHHSHQEEYGAHHYCQYNKHTGDCKCTCFDVDDALEPWQPQGS